MAGGNSHIFWIIGLIIALCICLLVWQRERLLKSYTTALATKDKALAARDAEYAKLVARIEGLQNIIQQGKIQFPWLASAIADFHALESSATPRCWKVNNIRQEKPRRRCASMPSKGTTRNLPRASCGTAFNIMKSWSPGSLI